MKTYRILTALFLEIALVFSNVTTAFALPPLPSPFWGTVVVDGAAVPAGTLVEALIGGQVFASDETLTNAGASYYALEVPGDDPETPAVKEGGVEGETVHFRVGGLSAPQTGIWHSGSLSVQINLTAANVYELTVSHTGTGSGTVTSDPEGIDCGTECFESYDYNTSVTLTAEAAPGSTFAGWSGAGCTGTGTCEVTMNAAQSVTAEFTQDQYTLTVTSEHGTFTKDPDQATYIYGQEVELEALPADGWSFVDWSGDINSAENPVTITMNGSKAVTANYTDEPTPITVTATSGQSKVFGDEDPVFTYTSSISGVTFTGTLDRETGENVGIYDITQGTLEAAGNYVITFVSADFSITPKPITVTAHAKSKVYGATDPALTYTSSESGVTFTGALSRDPGEDVGPYAIRQGTLAAGGNYAITFVSANLTITAKSVTVTANAQSKVFGAADPILTYTSSESGVSFTGALSRTTGEDIGTYPINQGTLLAGDNYAITFVPANLTITPKPITVTAAAQSKVFGTADPALTYTSSDSGAAFTGALSRVGGENTGTYAITQGTLSAGDNYTITFVPANLTITPKPITITADSGQSKVFGDDDPAFTYASSESGITFTGILSRELGENVGIYAITQGSLSAGDNYTITFVSASFTIAPMGITVTAHAKTKVYGADDPVLTYTSSESGITFTGALSRDPGEDVGTYAIRKGTLSAGDNYAITLVSANLTITAKPITVTANSGQSKVFGDDDPVFTYTSSQSGVPITGALSRDPGEDVGTYAINQGSLSAGGNYTITFVSANFSITPKPVTVTAIAHSKVYGSMDPIFTYTSSEAGVTFTGELSRTAGEDVGTYAINQGSLAVGGNYTIVFVPANLTITPKPVTVTANAQSKVFGAADPAFIYISSEAGVTFTGELSRVAGENVGSYAITKGSLSAGSNYSITFISANLIITPKPITVTAAAKSKIYGAADPMFTYTSSESGVTFTGALSRAAGENVGTYAITQGSLSAGSNYTITFVPANLTITPAALTIAADNKSKVAGTANPVFTATYTGFVNADDQNDLDTPVTLSTSANESSPAGTYVIVASGAADANYTITFVNGILSVTPAAFDLLNPANAAIDQPASLTLSWQASAGATGYEYCYDTSDNSSCNGSWTSAGTNTSVVISGLSLQTTYYWLVRATHPAGTTEANGGTWWSFTTVPPATTDFGKTSPAKGATGQSVNTTLTWEASLNADSYEYCYDTTNNNACSTWISNGSSTSKALEGLNPKTTYYWQVRAINASSTTYANGSDTAFWSFKTSAAPGAFNKTAPANNARKRPTGPTLKWGTSKKATSYEYCIDTTRNNVCDSSWISVGTTSASLSGLTNNTTYYWQVRAVGLGGYTYADAGAWFKFKVIIAAPELFTPDDGAFVHTRLPAFDWAGVSGATGYTIEASTVPTFATQAFSVNVVASNYTHTSNLKANKLYYWRVRSNGTNGPSAYSEVRTFTTGNPPSIPVLSSPVNNALLGSTTVLFDWGNATVPQGAAPFHHYQIQISTSKTFTSTLVDKETTPTDVNDSDYTSAAELSNGGKYYWRVRSWNDAGDFSGWSAVFSVRIKYLPPVLVLPENAGTNVKRKPTFDWNDTVGATSYTLQVSTSPTFSVPVIDKTLTDSTYVQTARLLANKTYYWRVRVNGPNGPSRWSPVFSFTTAP